MHRFVNKISLLLVVALVASFAASAQSSAEEKREKKELKKQKINELVRQAEEGVLVYQKQSVFGIQLRTNGYGIFYEMAKMKTNRKSEVFRIDLTESKHVREEKLFGNAFIFGNPYIFGKRNYFYPLTLGYGQQYIFGQKGNKNGVAVTGIWNAGISLGLLRPYYIRVDDLQNGGEKYIKYSVEDSIDFVDKSIVIAGGGLGKGWGEIKVKPGAFAKVGMRFDYGRYNETVSALEIGMSLEAYGSKIPILLYQKEPQMFFQGYVAIVFGKRK